MKEKTVCFECGAVLTEGNSYTLDGNTMCEECFERLTEVVNVIRMQKSYMKLPTEMMTGF